MQSASRMTLGPSATSPSTRRGHRDAVVAPAVDLGGAERAPGALDREAVRSLLARDAERAEHARHRGDAVALLDAELLGVADRRRPARARGERAQRSGSRRWRAARSRRRSRSPRAPPRPRVELGDRLAAALAVRLDGERPRPCRGAISRSPVRVGFTPTPRTVTREPGDDLRGDEQERRGREVARDLDVEAPASSPDQPAGSSSTIGADRADRDAERAQHALGVIARERAARGRASCRGRRGRRGGSRSSPARSRPGSRTRARARYVARRAAGRRGAAR